MNGRTAGARAALVVVALVAQSMAERALGPVRGVAPLAPVAGLLLPQEARAAGNGPTLKVRKSFPAAEASGVLTDAVAIQCNTTIDPSSVSGATVKLRFGGTVLPGVAAVTGDPKGRRIVFTPASPLPGPGIFTLSMNTGVRSIRGNPLAEEFRMTFATPSGKNGTEVQPVPTGAKLTRVPALGPQPRVTWTYPSVGLGSVYADECIVRFTRPMDVESVLGGAFTLRHGGRALAGTTSVVPESGGTEFRFDPQDPLYPDTNFEILVTREARSDRGRPLKAEFRGSYATSPFKEGILPLDPTDFVTGPLMLIGRAFHRTTVLNDGRILVTGGQELDGTPLKSVESLLPDEGFFRVEETMKWERRFHASLTLPNGKVLVCGGFGANGQTMATAELFDPLTGEWNEILPMIHGRANHTATLLPDGRVLIAGGFSHDSGAFLYTGSAEIFDPLLNQWQQIEDMVAERGAHTATLLDDGRVLLVGGVRFGLAIAETYDYSSKTFTRTPGNPIHHRIFHSAAKTRTGSVLFAGGGPGEAEQYNPATGGFTSSGTSLPTGVPVTESPYYATLDLISLGRVMLLGGLAAGGSPGGGDLVLSQVQLWDSKGSGGVGAFFPMTFDLPSPRAGHTTTRLPDGSWIIVGGLGADSLFNERRTMYLRP